MKVYCKVLLSVKSLRTGLFAVCFLAIVCAAAGCGKADALLSELREEEQTPDESGFGSDGVMEKDEAVFSGTEHTEVDDEVSGQTDRSEKIYVHVCGAVKKAGVYELPAGSRFYEAVEAAGGFAEGACEDYLNMAALLADGSRLEIPTAEEIRLKEDLEKEYVKSADGTDTGNGGDASAGLININTADAERLCGLPGVGQGRAKAIIEYREKQGGFQKKEDIMQVSGIGEKMYERMEEYLTVE